MKCNELHNKYVHSNKQNGGGGGTINARDKVKNYDNSNLHENTFRKHDNSSLHENIFRKKKHDNSSLHENTFRKKKLNLALSPK